MTDFEPILRDANRRLSAELRATGQSAWSADVGDRRLDVLDLVIRQEQPSILVVEGLGVDPHGEVLVRDRVYAVDGRPVCWARSFFDPAVVAGSPIEQHETGPGGTPARLTDLGYEPVSFVEDVEFVEPTSVTAQERDMLQIDEHEAVVWVARKNITAAGRVVELTDMRLAASAYRFRWAWDNTRR